MENGLFLNLRHRMPFKFNQKQQNVYQLEWGGKLKLTKSTGGKKRKKT